jgi:zinc protease
MGNINGPDAMALAWMNDVGVKQMIGYTVPTWYGYQGWGILDYFIEQPGRYTMNQAFFANHHALVHRLSKSTTSTGDKRGLKFDRDVVAFYGDPAWSAKMANGQNRFEQTIDRDQNSMAFTITPNQGEASFDTVNNNGSQRGGRPFVGFFDQRIENIKITRGHELHPIVTDNFILVPRPSKCDPTKEYKVTFTFELLN